MAQDRCICLDIGGTLLADVLASPLPGAVDAVRSLRTAGYPLRFVTNTTSLAPSEICEHLRDVGMLQEATELYTPFTTAKHALEQANAAAGVLIAAPEQASQLAWFEQRAEGPAVLLATEAHDLTVGALQPAFRALLAGATLYALEVNRYFQRAGELVTDLGPVAAFLEYAAGTRAQVLGKPSQLLFETLATEVGLPLESLVMVGDDAEFDASRSVALGMAGVLIRSGKYRPGDETRVQPPPTAVLNSIAELPAWVSDRL